MTRNDKIVAAIETLREEEGASLTILCDNPDFFATHNAIECNSDWTGYNDERFTGNTLLDCLEAAVAKKHFRMRHPDTVPPQGRDVLGELMKASKDLLEEYANSPTPSNLMLLRHIERLSGLVGR